MNTERIYIAGPMTGKPCYNFCAFFAAEKYLLKRGFEVVNPAKIIIGLFGEKEYYTPEEVEICINAEKAGLETCDSIFLLRGWENSKGAKRELYFSLERGRKIYVENH